MTISNFIAGEVLDVQRLNNLVSQINNNDDGVAALDSNAKILQIKEYKVPSVNDTYVLVPSNTVWTTPIQITITPKSITSTIYIDATLQYRMILANGMSVGIKRDGQALLGSHNNGNGAQSFSYKGDTVNHHDQQDLHASVLSGDLSSTTFTVFIQPFDGTGEFNYGWGRNSIKITEVED